MPRVRQPCHIQHKFYRGAASLQRLVLCFSPWLGNHCTPQARQQLLESLCCQTVYTHSLCCCTDRVQDKDIECYCKPFTAWRRGQEALVTAGKRYAREQLNLDLTPCNHWLRFLEVHYQRPPPTAAAEALETSEVRADAADLLLPCVK